MKKLILRTLIAVFIIISILISAGLWYAQNVFLPKKLKPLLIETAQKSAGLKIELENVSYKFPGVFSIDNLTIFEKDIPAQKFITIQKAAVTFKLFEILFKKQIIINRLELKTLQVYPGPGHTFKSCGDVFIDGEFSCKLNQPDKISYSAILTLKNQDIKHMPLVKDIAGLNGQIKIEPDKLSIIKLKGNSYGCPVEFAGHFENFKDPYLDLTETIDLDLSKINNFLSPKINKAIKQIALSGKSAVILRMSGKFSEWPLKFNGSAKLIRAEAKIHALANPIKTINGDVTFDENSLSISEVEAQYNDLLYTLKANITNFSSPKVYAVLSSQDLLLEVQLRAQDDYTRFDAIEGSWFNSNLNLAGDIQNYQNPQLKLSGDANINLEDIQKILLRLTGQNEKLNNFFNNLKPKGICNMSLFLDGLINDFSNCELGIKAASENINISGFNLGPMDMTAQLKEKTFLVPKLQFTPYDGNMKIQGAISPDSKHNVDINISDVNLEKLIKDTGFKDKNIWGILSMSSSLEGTGNDLNNLKGTGWLMVSSGHLWEIPLLGKLAETLQLAMLTKVEIKEAAGNFTIADRKISTQNLQFLSPQLNMSARGNLGFAGELDFNIGLTFAPGFAQENEFTRLAMLLADETGRLIGQINLGGTLKEPKYKYIPLHLDKIFKGQIIQNLKSIFKKRKENNPQ